MKTFVLLISLIISLTSCNDNETNQQDITIVGTWELIETYGSNGGSNPQWTPVNNGYTYDFKNDGTFTSTRFKECTYGTYKINNNSLILDFGCVGFNTGIENPAGTFVEKIAFQNNNIILTPDYVLCIEGCGNKFQKK